MKYYAVTCKRGHCGVKQYFPITFAIEAESLLAAYDIAKMMPGIKHRGNAILKCEEITHEEYVELRQISAYERSGFM